jgi:hypothetical protein
MVHGEQFYSNRDPGTNDIRNRARLSLSFFFDLSLQPFLVHPAGFLFILELLRSLLLCLRASFLFILELLRSLLLCLRASFLFILELLRSLLLCLFVDLPFFFDTLTSRSLSGSFGDLFGLVSFS